MEGEPAHVAKRRKVDHQKVGSRLTSSRLFAPFRTVGLVSPTQVPFTTVPLGKTTFQITTSVGRSLQTYDLRRGLNLVFLSRPQCPATITATCAYRDRVFVAWGGKSLAQGRRVWVYKRGRWVAELDCTDTLDQTLDQILLFGNWIIGCGSKGIDVWKNDSYEHYTTIVPAQRATFTGHICTLPTFLNKIFVGLSNGNIEIYNVSTAKLVHTIHAPSATSGRVTAISAASALGVLAVAYADASLVLHDVDTDDQILSLRDRTGKAITSITFRSDGMGAGDDGRNDGVMATASIESGDITMWDLNRGAKVTGVVRGAHETSNSSKCSGITKVEFLLGQPVIVSSGLDNAIRSWVFDETPFSPTPRILHSRSGHAAPVTKLNFLPAASDGSEAAGKWLLSAGQDRSLWSFSLRKDGQNAELSQGNVKHKSKKMGHLSNDASTVEDFKAPPIVDIACCLNRDGGIGGIGGPVWTNPKNSNAEEASMTGWESIVTAHSEDRFARTWCWGRRKAGRWTFESGDGKPVTSVAITACGTFALVGSAGGSLDMFNLQSGMHRLRFPPKLKPAQANEFRKSGLGSEDPLNRIRGHKDCITGVVVDNLNRTLLSASVDGTIIFWEFMTGKIVHRLTLESTCATSMRYSSVSGLVAMACDDLCIRILDIETRRIVRELWGCVGQINSLCFSHDGRWIVACSMDSVIRVFDLATGHLVDAFRTATCTNVAFSSTGEYLATTHAGALGINIWNNKSLFSHISSRQIEEVTGIIDLTEAGQFEGTSRLAHEEMVEDNEVNQLLANGGSEIDQLDASLLTLSLMPRARWQTLLNLETIRQRNRPIQPAEKPKAAPFFLGSTLALAQNAQHTANSKQELHSKAIEQSRIARLAAQTSSTSSMSALLTAFASDTRTGPTDVTSYLSSLPPSAADLEIRSLSVGEMPTFVAAMTSQLRLRTDFELVNTWISVFLKMHGDFVGEVEDLRLAVLAWRRAMQEEEKRLGSLVGYTKGVVEFLRSAR